MSDKTNPSAASEVEIYTDGACEPNPGPGGYGVVLSHPKKRAEASGGFRLTTNNRMEIYAAIKAPRTTQEALQSQALQRFAIPGERHDRRVGDGLEGKGLVAHQQGTRGQR